jgi:sec-independent protein translocase protein TatB
VAPTVIAPSVEMTVFDLSWGHLLAVAVVALVVIGPKELPAVLRTVGQWTTKIRRMAAEFQGQFQEALREAEMADLKKEIDSLHDTARGFTSQVTDSMNFQDATKWEPAAQKEPAGTAAETPQADVPQAADTPQAEMAAADAVTSPEPAATAEAAAVDAAPGAIEAATEPVAAADSAAAVPPSPEAGPAKGASVHDA